MRLTFFALGFLLTLVAAALFVTGGFTATFFGIRLSARSPSTAAIVAALAFAAWAIQASRAHSIDRDLQRILTWIETRATTVIVIVALLAAAVSIYYGTFSASGADASGYLSQAEMLSHRQLTKTEPLAAIADWPEGPATLAPLGWRARDVGEQVPTYAVGMPLLMALLHRGGGALAASLIVPISFAIAIAATGLIAMRVAGGGAGVIAATAFATSPVALIEAMQPMSDVPVTAAWMVCWWVLMPGLKPEPTTGLTVGPGFSRGLAAGLACAIAILIRPNLAPLAAVPALYILSVTRTAPLTARARSALAFAVPVAVAGIIVAWLQWRWFGSPLRSGYGTAEEIFSVANIAPNAVVYTRWLLDTHGPGLLLAPLALLVATPLLRWMLTFAALICASYLLYAVFDNWTYLRFLLPAMAVAMVAIATLVVSLLRRAPTVMVLAVVAIVVALPASQISEAREHGVFRLEGQHARGLLAGRYLDAALPANAFLISGEQSGAMRYYTRRSILRWDLIGDADLTRALERVAAAGREPWFVLDEWEEAEVRRKFGDRGPAALDWPPALDAGRELRTRAWRLADRSRYLSGGHVITDRLR